MPTYTRNERLCDFHLRQMLFTRGKTFFCYPFRVVYLKLSRDKVPVIPVAVNRGQSRNELFDYPAKCMVTVPTRRFKKAVDRNLIKRRFREAYRKNKSDFYSFLDREGYNCLLAFIYTGSQIVSFAEMDSKITVSLQKLMENLSHEQLEE